MLYKENSSGWATASQTLLERSLRHYLDVLPWYFFGSFSAERNGAPAHVDRGIGCGAVTAFAWNTSLAGCGRKGSSRRSPCVDDRLRNLGKIKC